MNIQPLHDRIVLKLDSSEQKSTGGILLPDSAQEKPQRGKVIAAGPGQRLENGALAPMDVKVGDTVLYGKYSGTEVTIEGEDVVILRSNDVLGILTNGVTG